ncbi:FAD binding domain-containing protein, partial [Mycobacterium sp.]|uniref:FAD binding domain-containing protein n=1 Tax=Mycobacterium sp. TaxID=1785 RepID=UPI0025E6D5CA
MDLNTVTDLVRRPTDRPGANWSVGDAWLAGGTWLFSEPQPTLRRLVDLTELGWPSLVPQAEGLEIAATCTIRELHEFVPPNDWPAGSLLRTSCEAFLASFKVWNAATVGGNICMSLPAGPMITMTVALEATYHLWGADGTERTIAAKDFVVGNHKNVLRPGEILRSVHISNDALCKRSTHRRFTLTKLGRSTIFMIATQRPA